MPLVFFKESPEPGNPRPKSMRKLRFAQSPPIVEIPEASAHLACSYNRPGITGHKLRWSDMRLLTDSSPAHVAQAPMLELPPFEIEFIRTRSVRRALRLLLRCNTQKGLQFVWPHTWRLWIAFLNYESEHDLAVVLRRRDSRAASLVQKAWRASKVGQSAAQRRAATRLQSALRGHLARLRFSETIKDALVMARARSEALAAAQASLKHVVAPAPSPIVFLSPSP